MCTKNCGSFLGGVILGAVVGGVVALLYAPTSGKEARKILKKKAKEVGGKALEIKEQVVDGIEELKEKGEQEIKGLEKKTKKFAKDFKKNF